MFSGLEKLPIELLAREIMSGFLTGIHSSPFQGFSVEFAEHRSYNPGDSLRHVDWKLLARTDKMFVKKYEEETNLRCQFVIDVSSSMLFPDVKTSYQDILHVPNKLQFSLLSAFLIMNILKKQRDAYGLTLFDREIVWHKPPSLSAPHLSLLTNIMNEYLFLDKKNHSTEIAKTMEELAFRLPMRSMVVIFSDTWEKNIHYWNHTLSVFKYKKSEVIFFHVSQKKQEAELDYDFRPMEFHDMERSEKILIHSRVIQDNYRLAWQSRWSEIKNTFTKFGFDYVDAFLEDGYKRILETYLLKRKYFSK